MPGAGRPLGRTSLKTCRNRKPRSHYKTIVMDLALLIRRLVRGSQPLLVTMRCDHFSKIPHKIVPTLKEVAEAAAEVEVAVAVAKVVVSAMEGMVSELEATNLSS